jgi:serine/threonine protein kinase
MNYNIKKVIFEINNFSLYTKKIIGLDILVYLNSTDIKNYKISNYIGKGATGQVYLIQDKITLIKYVIKISNSKCLEDLIEEVTLIEKYFRKNNITHPSYPIYYGSFKNLESYGIIYPYFGFYNLEKIKTIDYKIDFTNNKKIIIQLIDQLINLKNILHCDLKSSNVVIDIRNNDYVVTIIDFGLIQESITENVIVSTNYIMSPESLLLIKDFLEYTDFQNTIIKFDKHDYFGLFSIIINLFTKKTFWFIISKYLVDIGFNHDFLYKQNAMYIFVYMWYKFSYRQITDINKRYLVNLIEKIEIKYPQLTTKKYNFMSYNDFFTKYIDLYIDYDSISREKIEDFKFFTKSIIEFDYSVRPDLEELKIHSFLQ